MSRVGAVIQAGGAGRRLRAVTGDAPKALAPFLGRTLVEWQLARVAGVTDRPVVLAHSGAGAVMDRVGDRADVRVEAAPLGTAGGLSLLPDGPTAWLVINVDHASDVDLAAFVRAYEDAGRPACLAALSQVRVPVDEGVVDVVDGRVTRWRERPVLRLPITTGLYLFDAAALRGALDGGPADMPGLVEALMPRGVVAWTLPGWWLDAGTPARLARAEARILADRAGAGADQPV